jgi:resuscitation-promoting factor RpfB
MRVRPSRVRRLRIRQAIGNAALVGAVLAAGTVYLALEKNVTLVVDGRPQAVRTLSGSVGELLDSSGIVLRRRDVVVPSPATPLADGMTVVVVDGAAVDTVGEGPADVGVWVMEGAGGTSANLTAQSTENWFSASQPIGPSRMTALDVVVMGKDHDILTNAGNVRELLSAMGIEPDGNDRVLPSPRTPLHPGMRVRFTDVEYRTRHVQVPVPFEISTTFTDRLDPGEVRVLREGAAGLAVETYRVKLVDGKLVGRAYEGRETVRAPVPERRLAGQRETHSHGSEVGEATWYYAEGTGYTAAHPWLPFGTVVTVTDVSTGKSVQVVINDRGPFGGRIIDLSPEAFQAITGNLSQGICQVRLSW